MITIGNLDTPVSIQKQTFTANVNYGGVQAETWTLATNVEKVWAYLIWKSGSEREEADQMTSKTNVEFYIRFETYKDEFEPNWRIAHSLSSGSVVYYYVEKIAHIDGRHKMTRLTATLKPNN